MTQEYTYNKTVAECDIENIKYGLFIQKNVANYIKWELVGAYASGNKALIETIEDMFKKGNSLYDFRAYKTESKYVYNALKNGEFDIDIETVLVTPLDDDSLFSIGVAYKNRTVEKKTTGLTEKKIAQRAIKSDSINTDGIKTAGQLLALKDNASLAPFVNEALAKAEQELNIESVKSEFPEFNTDNLPRIMVMMKEYLTELAGGNFDAEFDELSDHMTNLMTVRTAPLAKAA